MSSEVLQVSRRSCDPGGQGFKSSDGWGMIWERKTHCQDSSCTPQIHPHRRCSLSCSKARQESHRVEGHQPRRCFGVSEHPECSTRPLHSTEHFWSGSGMTRSNDPDETMDVCNLSSAIRCGIVQAGAERVEDSYRELLQGGCSTKSQTGGEKGDKAHDSPLSRSMALQALGFSVR